MNCQRSGELLMAKIYGTLSAEESQDLHAHLAECVECSMLSGQISERFTQYQDRVQETGDPTTLDWEKSWRIISDKTLSSKKLVALYNPPKKLVFAGAAAVLVFVIGFYAGHNYFNEITGSTPFSGNRIAEDRTPLQSYAETVELLLIDFNNRDHVSSDVEHVALEQELILEMLIRTKLLKYLMTQRENTFGLNALLEDLELVLINMSNLRPEDTRGASQLSQFIRDRQLQFRLHQLTFANSL